MSNSLVGGQRAKIGMLIYVLAAISLVLAIVSLISPTWLEQAFGLSPDAGNGEAEWGIVIAFAVAAAVLAAVGRRVRVVPATTR